MLLADVVQVLVIGNQKIWRVPIWVELAGIGQTQRGAINVDVTSGALLDARRRVSAIMAAAEIYAEKAPSFAPWPTTDEFVAA